MVKIQIERENGKISSFLAKGHTAFRKKGEDIVCAGISSILQTAILGLKDYLKVGLTLRKGIGCGQDTDRERKWQD
ncbi:MAG: ribosomal-processing cysteine protease Prp [Candidatus Desantisbacteria bacterium]